MSSQLKRIQAAIIDGRAQTPRFIQKQLTKLHEVLVEHSTAIKSAIKNDSSWGDAEAEVEYFLTLDAVRQAFSSLDFSTALTEEYSLAASKDNPSRRVAYGCVNIIPSHQNPFYSTVVPLAIAIRAGNCVVLEIKQNLSELNALLRKILTATLDKDTFCVLDSKPGEAFLSKYCIILDGQPSENPVTTTRSISTPSYRTIAIIDRSAQVADAAREVTRARFAFGGRSAYAPDLVLVNEFILKDFCIAVTQHATSLFAGSIDGKQQNGNPRKNKQDAKGQDVKTVKDDLITLVAGSKGSIVLARNRNHSYLNRKTPEPVLLIHPMSSLDDAIDLSNLRQVYPYMYRKLQADTRNSETPLLATYLFAEPPAAKYLSQFINAHISCTNAIPADLLVGPPAPIGFASSIHPRYTTEMFSRPQPELINISEQAKTLAKVLDEDDFNENRQLSRKALEALPSMNEPAGKAIGFFEQGIITGGVVLLMSTVATVVVSGFYVVPAIIARARR